MSEYKVSRRIGRGGMAEVFLGLQEGLGGFEKLVVIKRIFPHFCEDDQFVQMFLDEARLAASIRHPNVVEILDIRRDKEGFFIVMEYLDGEALSYILATLREQGETMPVTLACRIGADVAAGLHEAHARTDTGGEIAPIIHRDVTPSNVIVCFSGATKIVDFGVAKATREKEESRPGSLKGKFSYLAPEQVNNKAVDPRIDVFQLGVVLHEMLTGEQLFREETERLTMDAILTKPIPRPSSLNPDVPDALDEVIMAALERDPKARTGSADQLQRQLESVLSNLHAKASVRDVGDWMQDRFAKRHAERKRIERECTTQMREGRPSSELPAMLAPFAPTAPVVYGEPETTKVTVVERPSRPIPRPSRRAARTWQIAVIAVLAITCASLAIAYFKRRSDDSAGATASPDAGPTRAVAASPPPDAMFSEPATISIEIETIPTEAAIELDGKRVATGTLRTELRRDDTTHQLHVHHPGYRAQTVLFRGTPPPRRIELQPLPTARKAPPSRKILPPPSTWRSGKIQSKEPSNGSRGTNRAPAEPAGIPPSKLPGTDNPDPWGS